MSQLLRLHQFPLSPFSRKVRIVLGEKRQQCEEIIERFWNPSADFLMLNPAGKVPVLKVEQAVLAESTAICEYLDEEYPEPPLLPDSPLARAEVRRLVGWFDDKFYHDVTNNLLWERLMKKVTGGGAPESRKVMVGLRNFRFHIDYMTKLLDRRRWLAGDSMTACRHLCGCPAVLSRLPFRRGLGPERIAQDLVRDDQVAPVVPVHPQ